MTPSTHNVTKAGYTFLEVVLALVVLTIGLAGTFGLTGYLTRANQWSDHVTEGSTLAQGVLESLRDEPFSAISSGSDTVGLFSRTWTVTTTNQYKKVHVSVAWNSVDQASFNTTLDTLFATDNNGSITIR